MNLSKNYSFMYLLIDLIRPYLTIKDLVNCSKVCALWGSAIKNNRLWNTYRRRMCRNHIDNFEKGSERFLQDVLFSDLEDHDMKFLRKFLRNATRIKKLALIRTPIVLECDVKSSWANLTELHLILERNVKKVKKLQVFKHAPNLESLYMKVNFDIVFDDLNNLRLLKRLHVDALYSKGFLNPEHTFLKNLTDFFVGFSYYEPGNCLLKTFHSELISLIKNNFVNLQDLEVSFLESETATDFNMLETISEHEKITNLTIYLSNKCNLKCLGIPLLKNIKNLCIKSMHPQKPRGFVLSSAAMHYCIVESAIELKDTLETFTWELHPEYLLKIASQVAFLTRSWKPDRAIPYSDKEEVFMSKVYSSTGMFDREMCLWKTGELTFITVGEMNDIVREKLSNVRVVVRIPLNINRCDYCTDCFLRDIPYPYENNPDYDLNYVV